MKENNATKPPAVSIGMPVYNGEPYIREALDSLLAQTFPDFEVIISDNASTDNTQTICQEYAGRDSRVRYVRQSKNTGALANFQFVLGEAQGEYFLWAAADDCIDTNWLSLLIGNFTEKDVGLFGAYLYLDTSGKQLSAPALPVNLKKGQQLKAFMIPDTSGKCFYIYSLFRRNSIAKVRIFDSGHFVGSDQINIMQILAVGNLRSIPGVIYRYRVHSNNTSLTQSVNYGKYKRIFLSTFPFEYYRQAVLALPLNKRILGLLLVPVKFCYEQSRSYFNFFYSSVLKTQLFLRGRRVSP